MNNASNVSTNVLTVFNGLFCLAVLAVGLVNTLWGNDPGFGVFLILLAFVYSPRANAFHQERTGFSIPGLVKISLGIFIIWASLGVGELVDKINLMIMDLH